MCSLYWWAAHLVIKLFWIFTLISISCFHLFLSPHRLIHWLALSFALNSHTLIDSYLIITLNIIIFLTRNNFYIYKLSCDKGTSKNHFFVNALLYSTYILKLGNPNKIFSRRMLPDNCENIDSQFYCEIYTYDNGLFSRTRW